MNCSRSKCTPTQCKQIGFEIKNESEIQGHLKSKLIGTLTVVKCIWCPNLETVTSICGDLSSGQTQNGVNFDFNIKFDLEVKVDRSTKQ